MMNESVLEQNTPGKIIGIGRTAEIREWSRDKVIKIYFKDMPDEMVKREWEVCRILSLAGAPAPACHDIINLEDGREGLVFRRINGETLGPKYYSHIFELGRKTQDLISLHRSIQIPVDKDSGLPSVKERIIGTVKALTALADSEKEKIIRLTEQLPEGSILCHGDFHPDNVMIENGKHLVVDWMTAGTGPAVADAVRTYVLWRFVTLPDKFPSAAKPFIRFFTKLLAGKYLKDYLRISGIRRTEADPWILPMAAARLLEGFSGIQERRLVRFIRRGLKKQQNKLS